MDQQIRELEKKIKNKDKEQAKFDRNREILEAKKKHNKRYGREAQRDKTFGRPERTGK